MARIIHCKTEEQFQIVLKVFTHKGWNWVDKQDPMIWKDYWNIWKENTGIRYQNEFRFGRIREDYGTCDFDIISFEEFCELEHVIKETDGLSVSISKVHESMEGRYELTGTDLYDIHFFLCEHQGHENWKKLISGAKQSGAWKPKEVDEPVATGFIHEPLINLEMIKSRFRISPSVQKVEGLIISEPKFHVPPFETNADIAKDVRLGEDIEGSRSYYSRIFNFWRK